MAEPTNGRLTERRLSELERDVGRLEERTEQIPVLIQRVNALEKTVSDQTSEIKSLRTTLISFALTVAGSAVAVLIAIQVASQ